MKISNLRVGSKKALSVLVTGVLLLTPGYFSNREEAKEEVQVRQTMYIQYHKEEIETDKEKDKEKDDFAKTSGKEPAILPDELTLEDVLAKKKRRKNQYFG